MRSNFKMPDSSWISSKKCKNEAKQQQQNIIAGEEKNFAAKVVR